MMRARIGLLLLASFQAAAAEPPQPPLRNGDVNADGKTNVADAVYLLAHLFAGGPAPADRGCPACDSCCPEVTRTLATGVRQWLDVETRRFTDACPGPGESGFGQDATYHAGVSRQYALVSFGDEDRSKWITVDYATGLMWQYNSYKPRESLSWENMILHCENLILGPFDDWRLPNVNELAGILLFPQRECVPCLAEGWKWQRRTIAQDYFQVPVKVVMASFWSSTPLYGSPDDGICVSFEDGRLTGGFDRLVRAVRTIQDGDLSLVGLPEDFGEALVANGDANGDTIVNVADAVYVLEYLFAGGQPPVQAACPACDTCCERYPARPLVTGATVCFHSGWPRLCGDGGQDGDYRAGVLHDFRIVTGGSSEPTEWMTADLATGLMWQYSEPPGRITWPEALESCEDLQLGGYDDWRLPNYFELLTIVNFGRYEHAVYEDYFSWREDPGGVENRWTSTPCRQREPSDGDIADYVLYVRVERGRVSTRAADVDARCYARAVRTIREGDLEALGVR